MASEESLKERLQDLQKQIGKKQMFEEAVSSIKSLLIDNYPSASPSLRKSIYSVVCRVATVLQTRYTAPGFWFAGKELFEQAERLVTDSSERQHLKACIARAREHLHEKENQPEVLESVQTRTNGGSRYLFEGHLTVDPEPPRPSWLVAQDFLNIIAAEAESSQGRRENNNTTESASVLMEELVNNMGHSFQDLDEAIEASLQEIGAGPQRPPPASKEVVKKLKVIPVTEEILAKLQSSTRCSVCQEELVIDDKMQELPCKHFFHPPCLKPWLDEHNSCPICRYELPTDDHAYESQKERDKEAEEERKGAANALRGGEYIAGALERSSEWEREVLEWERHPYTKVSVTKIWTAGEEFTAAGRRRKGRRSEVGRPPESRSPERRLPVAGVEVAGRRSDEVDR
ncbi:zinc finger protein [Macleaya cordata]|uniref:RING-type E3 ubiquitin transferase n=1 Tax=Macleaya cordata TaxID=56857 RepID=A0A200QRC2_MACCD|nr:zinc finger protein [Macleaya cordata]